MNTQSHWQALFITVLGLTALACITINVYFPEAAVRDLSEKIEDAVAREAAKVDDSAAPSTEDGDDAANGQEGSLDMALFEPSDHTSIAKASFLDAPARLLGALLDMTASDIAAQDQVAAPEITNPAIRKIVASRGQRAPQLERYKSMGVLGENNQALVEVRSLDALALRDRAAVQKLVREENADREKMFREIAAATQADLSQLPRIKSTYAETLRKNSSAGQWIQMPDGSWKQKS